MIAQMLLLAMLAADGSTEPRTPNCPDGIAGGAVANPQGAAKLGASMVADSLAPRLVTKVQPAYPSAAKADRTLTGKVIVQATVDIDGNVGAIETLQCQAFKAGTKLEGEQREAYCKAVSAAAEAAFAQWKYEPATKGEKKVCVYTTTAFNFKPE
jgi:outer membrane biosynthesis protein TonB